MPFFGKFSCFSFTFASVRQNAPPRSGVYGISNATEWLLIGSAEDVQAALHGHLKEVGTPLRSKAATGFTFEECEPAARQGRQDRLVLELRPACNASANPRALNNYRTR
jgi:hypothetical protein